MREVVWKLLKEAGYRGKVFGLIQRLYNNASKFRLGGIKGKWMGRSGGTTYGVFYSPYHLQYILQRQWKDWWGVSMGDNRRSKDSSIFLVVSYLMERVEWKGNDVQR